MKNVFSRQMLVNDENKHIKVDLKLYIKYQSLLTLLLLSSFYAVVALMPFTSNTMRIVAFIGYMVAMVLYIVLQFVFSKKVQTSKTLTQLSFKKLNTDTKHFKSHFLEFLAVYILSWYVKGVLAALIMLMISVSRLGWAYLRFKKK